MGDSAASLVYGLPLNAHDLVKAGQAYDKFVPNAFVLDLIIARKERGGVVRYEESSTAGSRIGLADVPIEVLDMIRWELLQSFVEEERSYFAIAHDSWTECFVECAWEEGLVYCDCVSCQPYSPNDSKGKTPLSKFRKRWGDPNQWGEWEWEKHDEDGCDWCCDMSWGDRFWGEHSEQGESSLRRLLKAYGLALPSNTSLTQNILNPGRADHLALIVALPIHTIAKSSSSTAPLSSFSTASSSHDLDGGNPPRTCHTASYFSPNFFDTSLADDAKFRRLVFDFNLRVEAIEARSITRNTEDEREEEETIAELDEQRERRWKEQVRRERELEKYREARGDKEKVKSGGKEDARTDEDDEPIPPAPPAVRPEWMLVHYTYEGW
ncbi:hypothetical protein MNV49_007424 [Pseudohyphozyma bogoriensis]|nr:hypothetical protein MNV49_007424 [Pseudohyphozyma bogoriensis]